MHCNTVKIKDKENGYLTINESDYDAELQTLFVEGEPEVKAAKPSKKTSK
tara:strand:+ start:30 stop:179 length:150 start_codon:yes stop_codon:yes gene_type:complete